MLSVVTDEAAGGEPAMSLDEPACEGAPDAGWVLETEVDPVIYIAAHAVLADQRGHWLVPPLAHGGRGAAAVIPARAPLQRFRAGIGEAVWVGGGAVGLGDHPAHAQWQTEAQAFQQWDLSEADYVHCWADGVHFSVRPLSTTVLTARREAVASP